MSANFRPLIFISSDSIVFQENARENIKCGHANLFQTVKAYFKFIL